MQQLSEKGAKAAFRCYWKVLLLSILRPLLWKAHNRSHFSSLFLFQRVSHPLKCGAIVVVDWAKALFLCLLFLLLYFLLHAMIYINTSYMKPVYNSTVQILYLLLVVWQLKLGHWRSEPPAVTRFVLRICFGLTCVESGLQPNVSKLLYDKQEHCTLNADVLQFNVWAEKRMMGWVMMSLG